MADAHMAAKIKKTVEAAARALGTSSPLGYVGRLIDETFALPEGDPQYASNTLSPGAVPFEPSFSEQEPNSLRFTIEPLGPGSSPVLRRDESTREMRRLVGSNFGNGALRWFDQNSEEWRGWNGRARLHYGAWFGTAYDHDGLSGSKVYYELLPGQVDGLPPVLAEMVRTAMAVMPALMPIFTTIVCRRHLGSQRATFLHRGPLRMNDLGQLMERLGLTHQLPSLMQLVGISLGGRFDLPEGSVLLGLADTEDGPEVKLEVLLGRLPDLPPSFLNLLALGLAERPRQLHALGHWLRAFTPEAYDQPGDFSVMSIRVTPRTPARISLYLRPVEFELHQLQRG
jgi:hypothetical protein